MLDCRLYGLNAGGHHATNIMLHTIAVLFLFHVLRQMTGAFWKSAIVAALFAVHPLHVESVAWISERKDVLSAVFFFLMLDAYGRYARAPSITRYLVVAALFVAGLMSKPMLVTAPIVLLVLDYWPLRRFEQIASTTGKAKILRQRSKTNNKSPFCGKDSLAHSFRRRLYRHIYAAKTRGWRDSPVAVPLAGEKTLRVTSFTCGKHCGRQASPFFILTQMTLWQLGRSFSRSLCCSPSLAQRSFSEDSDLICLPDGSGISLCSSR